MNSIILNFFADMGFILKVAFIVFLVVFVKQRITKNWLAITAIVISSVILIFFYWHLIGSIYVLYVLITIGIGGVLVDTFFVTMGEAKGGDHGAPDPQQMLGRQEYQNNEQNPYQSNPQEREQDVDWAQISAQRKAMLRKVGGRR